LTIITLSVGIYLIATTVVIAKDGVTFIEFAKNLKIAPTNTMIQEDQHPGYPAMIWGTHTIMESLNKNESLLNLIRSAQAAALISRCLAVLILYFIGKELVGAKFSFWAVLILIILPKPAEYGSDALSDWPHLFFLAAGMWLLIHGATDAKLWMFTFAGLAGGIGFLVRPECAQIVVYGMLWLGLQLLWSKRILTRPKAAVALVLLITGFAVTASPYMKLKGAFFPKKNIGNFTSDISGDIVEPLESRLVSNISYTSSVVPLEIAKAVGELFENIGNALMWFFLPPLIIGIYIHIKERNLLHPKKFFITALIVTNIPLMIWLYCRSGYISGRHILPLVTFTIFYIPTGIKIIASRLEVKSLRENQRKGLWFIILIVIGIAICTPKLLRSSHNDKQIYREAAKWLAENTETDASIAVPDLRISFYAQRKGLKYDTKTLPADIQYIVCEPGRDDIKSGMIQLIVLEDKDHKRELAIYKNVRQSTSIQ